MFFDTPQSIITDIKRQIREACERQEGDSGFEITDLTEHAKFQDMDKIGKLFDVKEQERKMENGFLNAIYSKLALKNLWSELQLLIGLS